MKILHINDFFFGGGAEGVFRKTHDLLLRYGYQSNIFFADEQFSRPTNLVNYFYCNKIKKNLNKVLYDYKPDVIHIHNYYHRLSVSIFSAICEYKRCNSVRVIFTAHDFHLISPSSNLLFYKDKPYRLSFKNVFANQILKKIDSRGYHYSFIKKASWAFEKLLFNPEMSFDLIISPSLFLISVFKKNGVRRPFLCIRNPLSMDPLESTNREIKIAPKKNKDIKFVYFGRLSEEKGLIRFLNLCTNVDKSINLDIIGDGPLYNDLNNLVSVNGLSNVRFLGYMESELLSNQLKKYDVTILPSTGYENAPLSIPESGSKGLVIFGSDLGGIQEICDLCNLPNFLFNIDDDNSFRDAYHKLLDFFSLSRQFTVDLQAFSESEYISNLYQAYRGEIV